MESRHFFKSAGFFVLIIALVFGAYALWNYFYGGPSDKIDFVQTAKNFEKMEAEMKAALKADTYGGKTPQETLDLFVEALRKEDVDLAAKYFMLDLNFRDDNQEYFLTRKKFETALQDTKAAGKLQEVSALLSRSVPDQESILDENDFKMKVIEGDKRLVYVDFVFNEESGVWKIESM